MTTRRPTIGNTAAINRFRPNGPTGYAAVYNDGTHGPTRATREEAEADYHRQTPKVQVTKDGPAYLLPGVDPAPCQRGDAEQLAMF